MAELKERAISVVKGKNVCLVGFGSLAKTELDIVKQIMTVYINKLEERTDYTELKIKLKTHQHIKSFIHELKADLYIGGKQLNTETNHRNLNKALALAMTKLLSEIEHSKKKSLKGKPIRKLNKKFI